MLKILSIILVLAIKGRWDELNRFLSVLPDILKLPPDDSAELKALTDGLKASDDALAASVAANQPK